METTQTPPSAISTRSPGKLRGWLPTGLLLVLAAAVAFWWLWTPPLTPAEQALVGKWTLPIGPHPPPNAVQQIFWLQPGHKLMCGSRPIGAATITYSMVGTWCLEDEVLILRAERSEPLGDRLSRWVGQAPLRGTMNDRLRILGRDGANVQIAGADGSVCNFVPLQEK